jgi:hypothetical protein
VTVEEYAAAQAAISKKLVREALAAAVLFQSPQPTTSLWTKLLQALFPRVLQARTRSAELGRAFYDAQRELHHPDLPRHDMYKANYTFDWFVEDMFPAREDYLKPGASEGAVEQVALRAVKSVENGGRRTILRAIDNEDEPDPVVLGWARVATGKETCGFCWMLVSRGPVYQSAAGAGLDLGDTAAQNLIASGDKQALDEATRRFHPGCDCLIVPVFNRADWPGIHAYKTAEKVWKRVTKGYQGQDAVNAFRRAVYAGELDSRDFAGAAAA